jgi:hypothetical protein
MSTSTRLDGLEQQRATSVLESSGKIEKPELDKV